MIYSHLLELGKFFFLKKESDEYVFLPEKFLQGVLRLKGTLAGSYENVLAEGLEIHSVAYASLQVGNPWGCYMKTAPSSSRNAVYNLQIIAQLGRETSVSRS